MGSCMPGIRDGPYMESHGLMSFSLFRSLCPYLQLVGHFLTTCSLSSVLGEVGAVLCHLLPDGCTHSLKPSPISSCSMESPSLSFSQFPPCSIQRLSLTFHLLSITLSVSLFPLHIFSFLPICTMQPFHLGHVSHHSMEGMEVDCM